MTLLKLSGHGMVNRRKKIVDQIRNGLKTDLEITRILILMIYIMARLFITVE